MGEAVCFLLQPIFKKLGQLYLGTSRKPYEMKGRLTAFQHRKEERKNVRAWIRYNEKGEQVFLHFMLIITMRLPAI